VAVENKDVTTLEIELNDGKVAPRYKPNEVKELIAKKAIITEKGTMSDLPIVDIQLVDHEGKNYFFCLSGRIFQGLAASVSGVNLRNHGSKEPSDQGDKPWQ